MRRQDEENREGAKDAKETLIINLLHALRIFAVNEFQEGAHFAPPLELRCCSSSLTMSSGIDGTPLDGFTSHPSCRKRSAFSCWRSWRSCQGSSLWLCT